jgi:hypothetical protein
LLRKHGIEQENKSNELSAKLAGQLRLVLIKSRFGIRNANGLKRRLGKK